MYTVPGGELEFRPLLVFFNKNPKNYSYELEKLCQLALAKGLILRLHNTIKK